MKRGINFYCALPVPFFYSCLTVLNSALFLFGIIILVYLLYFLIIKIFKKETVLSQTNKILLIVLAAIAIYLLTHMLVLSMWLPMSTHFSDFDLYTLDYIWLAVIIILGLIIVKKYFLGKLTPRCKVIMFMALIILVLGILATILKIKEINQPQPRLEKNSMLNPRALNEWSSCSDFKWY